MTHKTLKSRLATLAAAVMVSASLATPPAAGSIALTFDPQNHEDAMLMRTAFGIYKLVKAIDGGAIVHQNGMNNSVGMAQNGWNNQGIIHQEGKGHSQFAPAWQQQRPRYFPVQSKLQCKRSASRKWSDWRNARVRLVSCAVFRCLVTVRRRGAYNVPFITTTDSKPFYIGFRRTFKVIDAS